MAPGLLKSISTMDVRLPSHPSIYVIAALLISYAIYYTYSWIQLERERTAIKAQHGCLPAPPRDRAWDIFGLYALYELVTSASQHRLLEMFAKKFKQYGTTYSGVRRGKAVIATMDAEVFKTIHATKFDDWAVEEPRSAFHPLLGRGVFTTDGSAWHQSRSVLRPQFEKQQVAELGQFEPHVKKLIAKIPTDGSTVDLQDLFHKLTMDTSSEFLSGTSTGLLDEEYNVAGHQFADAFEFGCYDGIMRARLGRLYWLVPHFKAGKAIKVSRRYVDQWVKDALKYKQNDEKRSSKKEPYVFLRSLSMDERVNSRQMADEMLNIMLAGRDTTASLLSSMFFVLAREPEIEKKLRAEVDEFGGELPTYERLRDMKYIRYFAQEVLRLYPPVPALPKVAVKDTVIPRGGGPDRQSPLFVSKGSLMMYNSYSMMRSEAVYGADATTFCPERWADPSLRPGWNYLPFGGGARVCLGQQYALTEAYYVTIRLLQEFSKLENRDSEPWREKLTATCCSLNGAKVALYR